MTEHLSTANCFTLLNTSAFEYRKILGSRYTEGSSLGEVVSIPHGPTAISNLGIDANGIEDAYTTTPSHPQTRVRESYRFDSRRTALPVPREQNERCTTKAESVSGGGGNLNSGQRPASRCWIRRYVPVLSQVHDHKLPAASLPELEAVLGLPLGRGQGNLRCPIL